MRKTAPVLLVCILVIAGAFLIWLLRQPIRPNVSIAFLGYTNDASGLSLAQFAVTNLNAAPALVYMPFVITQQDGTAFFGYEPPRQFFFNTVLNGGAATMFEIPALTNQLEWKLQFYCYPNIGAARIIRNIGAAAFALLHVRTIQTMPYEIQSQWIRGSNSTTTNLSAPK